MLSPERIQLDLNRPHIRDPCIQSHKLFKWTALALMLAVYSVCLSRRVVRRRKFKNHFFSIPIRWEATSPNDLDLKHEKHSVRGQAWQCVLCTRRLCVKPVKTRDAPLTIKRLNVIEIYDEPLVVLHPVYAYAIRHSNAIYIYFALASWLFEIFYWDNLG